MTNDKFIKKVHKRLSIISIGASTLRNQGAPKMVRNARSYIEKSINLKVFVKKLSSEKEFQKYLEKHTNILRNKFPRKARKNWGAARKGLNIFFREAVYNKFICEFYGLPIEFKEFNETIKYLEVPLDKDVATALYAENKDLKKWKGIKYLKKETSDLYQAEAQLIAKRNNIARVHLDLIYWRKKL